MKKPVEAIERLRNWAVNDVAGVKHCDGRAILAYLDSIKEWPADLTRERLEELADGEAPLMKDRWDALRRLAELAPRGKRKVALWQKVTEECYIPKPLDWAPDKPTGWKRVGEAEIDA